MAVHTARLGIGTGLAIGTHNLYTAPTGKRTIVKSVVLWNRFGTAQRIVLGVLSGGVVLANWVVPLGATSSATERVIDLPWIVMNAGEVFQVAPQGGQVDVIVSGTELVL